jgi:hypothetical protein
MNARTVLVLGLVLLAGCQRLTYEKDYKIDPASAQPVVFDAPQYEQKLTVEVKSPGAPLSVYVVKSAEADKAQSALMSGKTPQGALGGKDNEENVNLQATVPAKTEFTLVLFNPGRKVAEAKVKVTGR